MNKPLIAAVAAALLIAVGASLYYFTGTDDVALAQRAIQGNGSATCTFTDPETGDEGTLYARRGDMRFTATTTMDFGDGDEQLVLANMMIKGDTVYQWAEGDPQGFKFSLDQSDELGTNEDEIPLRDADDEEFEREFEEYGFDCTRGVESGALDLPANVEFMDFSTIFETQAPATNNQNDMSEAELEELEGFMEEFGQDSYGG